MTSRPQHALVASNTRMPRTRTTLLVVIALVLAALATGCGGTAGAPPEAHATNTSLVIAEALGSAEAARELERRTAALQARAEAPRFAYSPGFGLPAALASDDSDKTLMAIARAQDRATDTQFKKTLVDKALDGISLRTPPLHAFQWVLTDRSPPLVSRAERERFFGMSEHAQAHLLNPNLEHKVYARVDAQDFYAMSQHARAAAVKGFYRDAERQFQNQGIRDFVLIVTPYTPTTEHLPALAVGRGGSASLTQLGRAQSADGV